MKLARNQFNDPLFLIPLPPPHETSKTEISELEALRRDLQKKEWESGGDGESSSDSSSPRTEKASRLPPGPFAAANAAVGGETQQREGYAQGGALQEERENDFAEYTSDGLRLASPKRLVLPPKPAAPVADDSPAFAADAFSETAEQQAPVAGELRLSPSEQARSNPAGEGVSWLDLGAPAEEAGRGGEGDARAMAEAPAGGYPKRLAGLMSFCRVSDRATCEILVEMGRVTVNGEKATDPGIKVDLMTDVIVANGEIFGGGKGGEGREGKAERAGERGRGLVE